MVCLESEAFGHASESPTLDLQYRTFAHSAILSERVPGRAAALVAAERVDATEGAEQWVLCALVYIWQTRQTNKSGQMTQNINHKENDPRQTNHQQKSRTKSISQHIKQQSDPSTLHFLAQTLEWCISVSMNNKKITSFFVSNSLFSCISFSLYWTIQKRINWSSMATIS